MSESLRRKDGAPERSVTVSFGLSYLVRTRYPFITGRYAIEGMTLIVSRGTGTWRPRMRLWSSGEISLVTLRTPVPG